MKGISMGIGEERRFAERFAELTWREEEEQSGIENGEE